MVIDSYIQFRAPRFCQFKKGRCGMPITLSYDLANADTNERNYIRSMFERFGWQRLGGSVLRYDGRQEGGFVEEDWLNDVAPALMFFRSYTLNHSIEIRFLTLDTNSVSRIDFSDPNFRYGSQPGNGNRLMLRQPTNPQSSESRIRGFIDTAARAT